MHIDHAMELILIKCAKNMTNKHSPYHIMQCVYLVTRGRLITIVNFFDSFVDK